MLGVIYMKQKLISLGIIVALLLTGFTSFTIATGKKNQGSNNLTLNYYFSEPTVKKIDSKGEYDRIFMDKCYIYNVPNKPRLPAYGTYILIPDGSRIKNVEVYGEKIKLDGLCKVEIGTEPVPLSQIKSSNSYGGDSRVYSSDNFYPDKLFNKVSIERCNGYKILVLSLHPVQYIESTGELFYYPELKVTVKTIEDKKELTSIRKDVNDENKIIKIVDNSQIINTYSKDKNPNQVLLSDDTEDSKMVIITSKDFVSDFQNLADYHNNTGVTTFFKTVEEIKSNSSFWVNGKWGDLNPENPFVTKDIASEYLFNDTQAWIRNYIRYAYQELEVEYVLLGGDTSIIPVRYYYAEMYPDSYSKDVPTDYYYSGLDNSFYINENERNEEWMDFIAEVYVGRAPVDNSEEIQNFVDKTIEYMQSENDPYLDKILLAGEYMGFQDSGVEDGVDFGGNSMDQLVDVCIDDYSYYPDDNYKNRYRTLTTGFPSNKFEIDKLYDRDIDDFDSFFPELTGWQKSDIIDKINSNYHIINHLGHGNEFHNMKLDHPWKLKKDIIRGKSNDLDEIKNTKPCFIYSQACNSGALDDYDYLLKSYDCIGEYMTVKNNYGAFAGLWNARTGWGFRDLFYGASQRYNREFWDAVFHEGITSIGKANEDSKLDCLLFLTYGDFRMVHSGLNLFGDPAVNFHIDDSENNLPDTPEKPEIVDENKRYANASCEFSTTSYDLDDDKIYYGWDWDNDDKIDSWTGPYESGEKAIASHIYEEPSDDYKIKVKATDKKQVLTDFSEEFSFEIKYNQRPKNPEKPTGSEKYKPKTPYEYASSTTDPDGDELYYQFYFDYVECDGLYNIPIRWIYEESEWLGPFESGEHVSATHIWSKEIHTRDKLEIDPQTFMPTFVYVTVSVNVKDEHGAESKKISSSLYLSPKTTNSATKEILPIFPIFSNKIIKLCPILSEIIKSFIT